MSYDILVLNSGTSSHTTATYGSQECDFCTRRFYEPVVTLHYAEVHSRDVAAYRFGGVIYHSIVWVSDPVCDPNEAEKTKQYLESRLRKASQPRCARCRRKLAR